MERDSILRAATSAAALVELGRLIGTPQTNPHAHGRAFVILPGVDGKMEVAYLERPDVPVRKTGTVDVADTESFVLGVNRYSEKDETVLYACLHPASFTAVLNDHNGKSLQTAQDAGAGWRDHKVTYSLAHSKEYQLWSEVQKGALSQEDFAFFIENNLPDFKDPEGARMLEIALNFRVKNNVAFKSALKLQDGAVDLQYTEQVEGSAGRTGNSKVPEIFKIEIPVWAGLDAKPYVFDARLRYRVNGGTLAVRIELVRPHKVVERAFKDVLDQIKKGVKDVPVVFGKAG